MAVEIGDQAPDFTLRDQKGDEVGLSELKGEKSLVVFMPFAFSPTCLGELCAIRDNLQGLENLGARVVVVTCDSVFTNRAWTEENGFNFPILSDFWPHGQVSTAYGAFNERTGGAFRSTYVLDGEGTVRAIVKTESTGIPREFERYGEALASI